MLIHAHLKRATALALVLSAATAGPAAARLELNPIPSTPAKSTQPGPSSATKAAPSLASPTLEHAIALMNKARHGAPSSPAVSTTGSRVASSSSGGGFDWGDAGIGAAGGLTISLIAISGGLAVTQRRRGQVPGPAVTA